MIAATLPACSAATARQVASVVFPTPPFCERMARTFMLHSYTYSPILVYAVNREGKPYLRRTDDRTALNLNCRTRGATFLRLGLGRVNGPMLSLVVLRDLPKRRSRPPQTIT